MRHHHEIETLHEAQQLLTEKRILEQVAFQSIDFNLINNGKTQFHNCLFIGCKLPQNMRTHLDDSNMVFPTIHVPYQTFRSQLYNASSLYEGYDIQKPESFTSCYDSVVYKHYISMGKRADDIMETLARTLHDHSMSDALHDFLSNYREEDVVAIMGGHALLRTDDTYRSIVLIAKSLTEKGKLMVSGGGPGAMEATHLGAWLAGYDFNSVDQAIDTLKNSPSYKDYDWLKTAFDVINRFPQHKYKSVGIPTWLYGHEPATPFATHIAKYFENSLREDGLLTIAKGGVIYTPGSAGTMQEIFQDATQNHYISFGYSSPMTFFGVDYWTNQMPTYTLLENMMQTGRYKNLLLSISDNIEDIVNSIMAFSPQSKTFN